MKRVAFFIGVLLLAVEVSAAAKAEKVERTYHQANKLYGKAEYFWLSNALNQYLVYFQWIKPTAKAEGKVVVGIPEPVFWQGFISRDFMNLTINGIKSSQLEPKSITTFTQEGSAGVDALYNFDGVRMTLRFYLTEKSPLLFMEWRKDPTSEEKIEKAELSMAVYPSYSVPNGGKRDERYRREILTPVRTISSPDKGSAWITLKPEDSSLVMYDAAFEPANTPKAQGPCFMVLNWQGIQSGRAWLSKIYAMNFRFILDPKANQWQFGLWEFKKPMNNQEFMDYKKNNEALLQLPPIK